MNNEDFICKCNNNTFTTGMPNLMKHMIKLHFGCNKDRNTMTIHLSNGKYEEWNEYDMHRLTLRTSILTGFGLGPKTVLQTYSDPYLHRLKKLVINDSETETRHWDVGCVEDHGLWDGTVRSFRVWDYHYYDSIYGVRYCNEDNECNENEYCLCLGGQKNPEFCKEQRKRCMPKSHYLHNAERAINIDDLVDMDCMSKEIVQHKQKEGKNLIAFRHMKKMAERCSISGKLGKFTKGYSLHYYYNPQKDQPSLKHQYSLIETFGTNKSTYNIIIYFVIFFVFITVIGLCVLCALKHNKVNHVNIY